jgi:YtzH-like protein
MPLNNQDQASVLRDILSNHQEDCCGSVAECEQVERLVKSLMANTGINQNVKGILQEIYEYGQHGVQSPDLDSHIESNQGRLSSWVNEIDHFSGQL